MHLKALDTQLADANKRGPTNNYKCNNSNNDTIYYSN